MFFVGRGITEDLTVGVRYTGPAALPESIETRSRSGTIRTLEGHCQ
jgi:hypothetical protein